MQEDARINSKHKDRLFRFIFNDRESLLSLYNAINESDYKDPEDLQIFTMNNFVYMGMKNDLSFLIDMNLNVYEHQSTYNPNMPLRGIMYMSSALQKYVAVNNFDIYSSRQIRIPIPRYYIFYNGPEDRPDEEILKLTDAMDGEDTESKSDAQLIAHMININAGKSPKIMERCPRLYEYSMFISEIRDRHASGLDYAIAVDQAVNHCIENNILADILRAHKAEVTNMLLEEYNEQFHIANEKSISQEEGIEYGRSLERQNTLKEKLRADEASQRADEASQRADEASQRADEASQRADIESLRASVFALTIKGKSPETIASELDISLEVVSQILSEV